MIIEGAISVKAAINNGVRDVINVYINKEKKTKDFNYIRKICKVNQINILEVDKEKIDELSSGKSHGGILAEVSTRRSDELIDGDIFYLEGIEDPFNLGYCLRTLYAFGIKNVILPKKDYEKLDNQLLKSSAGAYDMLKVMYLNNEEELLKYKNNGYYFYGLYRGENASDIFDCTFKEKSLFVLGGEKRGISSGVLKLLDEELYISYGSDFRNALNAAAALDVVATLLYRQKRK